MAAQVSLVVLSSLLLIAMLVLHGICLSFPYYAEGTNMGGHLSIRTDLSSYRAYYPNMNVHFGFWKMCFNVYTRISCYSFGLEEDTNTSTVKAPDWVIVCQALSIIGLIVGALGLGLSLLWLCVSSRRLLVAGSVATILGGITIIIADIVFSTEKSVKFVMQDSQVVPTFGSVAEKYLLDVDSSIQYSWNFGLDLATGIACVLIGALYALCVSLTRSDSLYISTKAELN
jgi:hypothetical protein